MHGHRRCRAQETFACDGQPGSYTDVDHCDVLFLVGHNVVETQVVLWARMLDRMEGPHRPKLVVVDPRPTVPAQHADVHLAIRPGTNLALLNAILHELIVNDHVDRAFVDAHTVGYDELVKRVEDCTAEWAAEICGVDAGQIREAARILGTHERILSTCLQGVYQSHQATAAAVQVNNVNLLRGALGKPGAGILQMNGQPTAQNTRECGANGDLPAFRNWANDDHVQELADLWNVDADTIPHYGPAATRSGPATSSIPKAASGFTPSRTSTPTRTTASPTGATSSPELRLSRTNIARSTRTTRRSSKRPSICPRPSRPATSTRCN